LTSEDDALGEGSLKEKPVEPITDKHKIDEQVAAHEAGHVVVGLAVGMQLMNIERIQGKPSDSYLSDSVKQAFATNFREPVGFDERLRHLNTAAGMAGEALFSGGTYYEEIGKDDLTRLRNAGLSETQIAELRLLAVDVLQANPTLFEDIWNTILNAIANNQSELINGPLVTHHFTIRGKKFTDFAKLEKIFTPGA
jgi:hypothetical protein